MPFDLDDRLADLGDASPTGDNLEFDPDFAALERAARGKPEQQYGEKIIPAEDPEWKDVVALGESLEQRTRDLRILAHLAVARLHLTGAVDFARTLRAIRGLLEDRWELVHPRLDPDEAHDPTLRANALLLLADPGRVLRRLRDLPLATSKKLGAVSWRHAMIVAGALEPDAALNPKPTEGVLRGVFADTDAAALDGLREALFEAAASAQAIPAAFDRAAGFGTGPELTPLVKLLGEMVREIDRYRPARVEAAAPAAAPEPGAAAGEMQAAPRAAPASALGLSAIETRAEALHLLDLVADYYRSAEPSSPLILLIARARRLAEMNFLDILRELAPEGLAQAQVIAGQQD